MSLPYPRKPVEIEDFKFHTPLVLIQALKAEELTPGRKALFILGEDYVVSCRYAGSSKVKIITAPAGMLTDLISSPFHSIVQPSDPKILGPAIIHDHLYAAWEKVMGYRPRKQDRKFSDDVLLAGMEAAGVGWFKRRMVYRSVRAAGWIPFNERDGRSYLTPEELQAVKDAKA